MDFEMVPANARVRKNDITVVMAANENTLVMGMIKTQRFKKMPVLEDREVRRQESSVHEDNVEFALIPYSAMAPAGMTTGSRASAGIVCR